MTLSGEVIIEIPFHDVDMMRVVWHGHYYKYFEIARTELFRQNKCDAKELAEMGLMLPVIETHCRYLSPLRYGMRVKVSATLVESEFRLKVNYLITEEGSGKRLAKGNTIQAVVRINDGKLLLPVPADITNLFPQLPPPKSDVGGLESR